jgi:dethiobiotin synthetase
LIFITGTDTGVGKTVLAALLARHWRACGRRVAALKPACSGGRNDARRLHNALDGALSLNEINPWHYRAPLAPPLAAQRQGEQLLLRELVAHIRSVAQQHELTLVEGAGGLLSPLTTDADNRDLLRALRATPVIVVPNRLGAINQARLAHAALSPRERRGAVWVLVAPRRSVLVQRLNQQVLRGLLGSQRLFLLPFLPGNWWSPGSPLTPAARSFLPRLAARLGPSGSR